MVTLRAAPVNSLWKGLCIERSTEHAQERSTLLAPPDHRDAGRERGSRGPDAGSLGPGACLAPRCRTCRLDLQPMPGPSLSSDWPDRRDTEDLERATVDQACQQGGHPPVAVLTNRRSWPCPLPCIPVANLHLSEPCSTGLADVGGVQPLLPLVQQVHSSELPCSKPTPCDPRRVPPLIYSACPRAGAAVGSDWWPLVRARTGGSGPRRCQPSAADPRRRPRCSARPRSAS